MFPGPSNLLEHKLQTVFPGHWVRADIPGQPLSFLAVVFFL